MNTYIAAYRFENSDTQAEFSRALKAEHSDNHHQNKHGIDFLGFRSREEPGVEGKIKSILNQKDIGDNDFVALIFNKNDDPKVHKRVMVLGHADNLENLVGNDAEFSTAEYDSLITDMLNAEFQK